MNKSSFNNYTSLSFSSLDRLELEQKADKKIVDVCGYCVKDPTAPFISSH
jgi:hypothetical protein